MAGEWDVVSTAPLADSGQSGGGWDVISTAPLSGVPIEQPTGPGSAGDEKLSVSGTQAFAPPAAPGGSASLEPGNWETQNNNFGGLRIPGVYASPTKGGFQSFGTPEEGVAAIGSQLRRYYDGKTTGTPLTTLNQIVSTWAPPSTPQNAHENDTPLLISRAAKIMGVSPDQPLDLNDPSVMAKLIEATIRNEQGGKLPIHPDLISKVAGSLGQYAPKPTTEGPGFKPPPPKAIEAIAATPDTSIRMLSPAEFKVLTSHEGQSPAEDRSAQENASGANTVPTLHVAQGDNGQVKVVGYDGRSRALAAQQAGVHQIPVAIQGVALPQGATPIQALSGSVRPFDFPIYQKPVTLTAPTKSERFIVGATDPVVGMAQLAAHMGGLSGLPEMNVPGAPAAPSPASVDSAVAQRETQYEQSRGPNAGFDWMRLAGNVASSIAPAVSGAGVPAVISAGTRLPGIIGTGLRAAAQGGASALAAPVTSGDYATGKGKQVAGGALAGFGLGAAGRTIGNTIAANVSPAVQRLADLGIRPTIGNMMGRTATNAESRLSSVPILSDVMGAGIRRQMRDFNQAIYDKILGLAGMRSSGKTFGTEGVKEVEGKLSAAFEKLKPKINFTLDNVFGRDVAQVLSDIPLAIPELKQFSRIMENNFLPRVADNIGGQWQFKNVTGEIFKRVESQLSALGRQYQAYGATPDNHLLGQALDGLNAAFRSGLERANPVARAELHDLNTAWAGLKRLQVAAANRPSSLAVFTPADLLTAEKRLSGLTVFARGDGLLQKIATDAQEILGNKYPDSGTVGRYLTAAVVGAGSVGALLSPAALAAAVKVGALALPYTAPAMSGLRLLSKTPSPTRSVISQIPAIAGRSLAAPAGLGLAAQGAH